MIAVLGSRTGAKQRLLQGLALAGASEIEPFNTIEAFTAANKPASLVVVDWHPRTRGMAPRASGKLDRFLLYG
jgi:hypothetical protein